MFIHLYKAYIAFKTKSLHKNYFLQELTGATPTKAGKKNKKEKGNKKHMNGDTNTDDRASPEANAQEQMALQRASGGTVDAPPEVVRLYCVHDS